MHPNPRRVLPLVVLLATLAAAGYWVFELRPARQNHRALVASGTIEATQVQIGAEASGKIAAVLVSEGDRVQAGQELARLDQALLLAQLEQARAGLAQAQANYDLVAAGAPAEQRQAAIAAAELELVSAQQALQALYDAADLARARAQQNLDQAQKALDDLAEEHSLALAQARDALLKAQRTYTDTLEIRQNMDFAANSKEVREARVEYDRLNGLLKQLWRLYKAEPGTPQTNPKKAMLWIKIQKTRFKLAQAERLVDLYGGEPTAEQIRRADANLALAEARLAEAQLAYERLKDGPDPIRTALAEAQLADARRAFERVRDGPDTDALALAQARLASAEARLAAAKAGPSVEQLALAQAQLDSARRAVETLEIQLEKLVVRSPTSGVVLSRLAEPGEFAAIGAVLLVIGREDDKTITVFIPEDRYGWLSIGQAAAVRVDSFPNQSFAATVIHIADQAEFTPRNVQTVAGRKNTVFAVRLKVVDPLGKLKAGMPADVTFQ